jgi:protoporphyrinogen oxidase
MSDRPILVIGTGFAAFGAGHRLEAAGRRYVVHDRNAYPGGHTASHELPGGFLFDDGPHVSFTKDERIQSILADAVGGAYESVPIGLDNHWQGRTITHPLQVNLHGLPTDLIVRILVDLASAHAEAAAMGGGSPADYETWLRRAYGDTFAETFPMTYGRKYHTTEMRNLTTDWVGPRMYRPSLEEALRGALEPAPVRDLHYVTHFRYPTHGGYAAYLRGWVERSDVHLGSELVGIDPSTRTASFGDGRVVEFDRLVSSVPLPDLVPLIVNAPASVVEAARRLAFTSVVLVNLGVDRPGIGGDTHIRYVYDEEIPFARISFPHRLSPTVVPAGASAIQVEWYSSEKYSPLARGLDEHIEPSISHLTTMGVLEPDDRILVSEATFTRFANVIYDHERGPAVAAIHAWLDELGIHYCGRYGEWNHLWTDESFMSGERAAGAAIRASAEDSRVDVAT